MISDAQADVAVDFLEQVRRELSVGAATSCWALMADLEPALLAAADQESVRLGGKLPGGVRMQYLGSFRGEPEALADSLPAQALPCPPDAVALVSCAPAVVVLVGRGGVRRALVAGRPAGAGDPASPAARLAAAVSALLDRPGLGRLPA